MRLNDLKSVRLISNSSHESVSLQFTNTSTFFAFDVVCMLALKHDNLSNHDKLALVLLVIMVILVNKQDALSIH